MDVSFMTNISDREDYLLALKAINNNDLSDEEIERLFAIYKTILSAQITNNDDLVRLIMYSDVTCLNSKLNESDQLGLSKLKRLLESRIYDKNMYNINDILEDNSMNKYIKIAIIKSILDILSVTHNISEYKNDIDKLIEFISVLSNDEFFHANILVAMIRFK